MTTALSLRRPKLRAAGAVAAVSAAGLFVAACGGTSAYSKATTNASAPTTTMPSTPTTIAVGASRLGQIVVDSAGHTLYRFDKDVAGSGSSACNGACAATWPPETLTGQPTAGPGLSGALGVLVRVDGARQLTLDGHPLYRYSGDSASGDTNGDGFGGIWHVVHTADAATPRPAPASPSGY